MSNVYKLGKHHQHHVQFSFPRFSVKYVTFVQSSIKQFHNLLLKKFWNTCLYTFISMLRSIKAISPYGGKLRSEIIRNSTSHFLCALWCHTCTTRRNVYLATLFPQIMNQTEYLNRAYLSICTCNFSTLQVHI